MRLQRGFTLIELMIVVAIIAILAAIAISQYQDYVIRAQISEGESLANAVKTSIGEFYNSQGRFPGNNTSTNLPLPASITGSFVTQVSTTSGIITATFGNKASTPIIGGTLDFSPTTNAGSIYWTCKAGTSTPTLQARWLPANCR